MILPPSGTSRRRLKVHALRAELTAGMFRDGLSRGFVSRVSAYADRETGLMFPCILRPDDRFDSSSVRRRQLGVSYGHQTAR
jgi:hypothetical protein